MTFSDHGAITAAAASCLLCTGRSLAAARQEITMAPPPFNTLDRLREALLCALAIAWTGGFVLGAGAALQRLQY